MADYGKQIHMLVDIPVLRRDPYTGIPIISYEMTPYEDRIITEEQSLKLSRHYNRREAQGEPEMD